MLAPVGTPEPVMAKLQGALSAALNDPATKEKIKKFGAVASYGGADDFKALLAKETEKWERVVKDGNIKVQ